MIGHGFTKGALFMLVGVLLHRFGTVDEFDLHGRGRELPACRRAVRASAGCCSARCRASRRSSASRCSTAARSTPAIRWLPTVFVISSILTGGAVLRAAGRVFLGWGASERREDVQLRRPPEQDEERIERDAHAVA